MTIFRKQVKGIRISLAEGPNLIQGTEKSLAKEIKSASRF